MNIYPSLSSTKVKTTLWVLLVLGVIGLSIVLFSLLKNNQSATFSLMPIEGTCYSYDYDNHQESPGLTNVRLKECKKHTNDAGHKDWYKFCFNNQSVFDRDCTLRAAEESKGQNGPDYDALPDNQMGFCHLGNVPGGKIIPNVSYRKCREEYPNWYAFTSSGSPEKTAWRRGIAEILYKRDSTAKLHDLTANCVLRDNDIVDEPDRHWGTACVNSQQWCAYDDPTFCVKNPLP